MCTFPKLAYIFYVCACATQLNFLRGYIKEIGFPARCNIFASFHFIPWNDSEVMSCGRRTDINITLQ